MVSYVEHLLGRRNMTAQMTRDHQVYEGVSWQVACLIAVTADGRSDDHLAVCHLATN